MLDTDGYKSHSNVIKPSLFLSPFESLFRLILVGLWNGTSGMCSFHNWSQLVTPLIQQHQHLRLHYGKALFIIFGPIMHVAVNFDTFFDASIIKKQLWNITSWCWSTIINNVHDKDTEKCREGTFFMNCNRGGAGLMCLLFSPMHRYCPNAYQMSLCDTHWKNFFSVISSWKNLAVFDNLVLVHGHFNDEGTIAIKRSNRLHGMG